MTSLSRLSLCLLTLPALLLSTAAQAGPEACGKFDFTKNALGCTIEVKASCRADCSSLKFTAACEGGCNATVTTTCTGSCETQCLAMCDPGHLDCVAGCHGECDQPFMAECQARYPDRDCVTDAKSSCGMHCKQACGVTVSDCLAHCQECCHGACTSTVNMDCDMKCFAEVQGGCEAQCEAPTGALFCNGQYVHASDVNACIQYLSTQGISVDVEARGQVTCDLSGCHGAGSASAGGLGCSASPGQGSPFTFGTVALGALGVGIASARRRQGKKNGT